MPSPLSRTASRTRPFSRPAVTTICVPGGVWVSALSIRIRMIWATRTGSQWASIGRAGRRSSRWASCWASVGSNSPDTERVSSPQVDLLGPQLERAGLELGQVEQVDRQLAQPLDLRLDLIQEAPAGLGVEVLVLEQLDEPAEREDRRAELVRGGGDELLARRARVWSSWRCISLKATASWPSSSVESTGIGCSKSPAATCSAASSRRLTRWARARATRYPPIRASSSAIAAGDQDLVADGGDVVDDVGDRGRVHDDLRHLALVEDRVGGLGDHPRRRAARCRWPVRRGATAS